MKCLSCGRWMVKNPNGTFDCETCGEHMSPRRDQNGTEVRVWMSRQTFEQINR